MYDNISRHITLILFIRFATPPPSYFPESKKKTTTVFEDTDRNIFSLYKLDKKSDFLAEKNKKKMQTAEENGDTERGGGGGGRKWKTAKM